MQSTKRARAQLAAGRCDPRAVFSVWWRGLPLIGTDQPQSHMMLYNKLSITCFVMQWLQAGVGCFVLNERQEVLMVQEGNGYFKGKGGHTLCSIHA